jgi:hypothetical protein
MIDMNVLPLATCPSSYELLKLYNVDRQHNKRKDIFKVEAKQMFWCILFVYSNNVYATFFHLLIRSSSGKVHKT